jgi:transposase
MTIIAGVDMHVKSLVCDIGFDKEFPNKRTFANDLSGHASFFSFIESLKAHYKNDDVLIGYEASGLGYVLYDRAIEAGFRCAVLAPTELLRSTTGFKKKTDKKDARHIYETLRGHILAGNRLCSIWVPDKEFREDRDLVRTWYDIGKKIAQVKIQVQTLLKKHGLIRPTTIESWSKDFLPWVFHDTSSLGSGFQISLNSLLRQLDFLKDENRRIEKEVTILSQKERYRRMCKALLGIQGVGLKTAMTFLGEMGDPRRFHNRRQIGSYIGLVPSTHESGESSDRKGRITRSGPYRMRSVLNQALWIHLRYNGEEKNYYDRIVSKNPHRKKKAVVACMRRLAIRMWNVARSAREENMYSQFS